MGVFSSKKKTFVDTSVMRVVEDEMVPDSMKTALARALFKSGDITGEIQASIFNNNARNFERMQRWASRPGNYVHGLPDATVLSSSAGFAAAEAVIEAEVGADVTIEYLHYRPINNIHYGKKWVLENWDWNPETNELEIFANVFGITVYMDKMTAHHRAELGNEPDQATIGTWDAVAGAGYTPERIELDLATGLQDLVLQQDIVIGPTEVESVEIHVVWIDAAGALQTDSQTLDLSGFDGDKEYYQAKYTYGLGLTGFWTYDPTTGVHPTLTDVFDGAYVNPGTYFPFVMFRSNDRELTADSELETEKFKTSEKLLDKLGMDYKELGDQIHENPDINDIDQAVMLMGVPIITQAPVEIEYLCRYFANLYDTLPDPAKDDGSRNLGNYYKKAGTPDESYVIQIQDADFKILISFDYVTKRLRAGNISMDNSTEGYSNSIHFESEILYLPAVGNVPNVKKRKVRRFRRQITDRVYEEILVANPQIRYDIYKNKAAVGMANSEILLIPLDYNVCREISARKREKLYFRSLHFVFNSRVVEKVQWYESGLFKALLVIVAVVITVWSMGSTWQTVAAAGAAVGATTAAIIFAFLESILIDFLIGIAIQFAFEQLATVIGAEAMLFLAIAAAAYGAYEFGTNSMVMNTTAERALGASTGLSAAGGKELESDFKELASDQDAFETLVDERTQILKEAKALLGDPINFYDPLVNIRMSPFAIMEETPDQYYNRTVHAGNVGTTANNLVQNFVEISLRLPTLHESLG